MVLTRLNCESTEHDEYNSCEGHCRLRDSNDPDRGRVDHEEESGCQRDRKQQEKKHEVVRNGGTLVVGKTNKEVYDSSVAESVGNSNGDRRYTLAKDIRKGGEKIPVLVFVVNRSFRKLPGNRNHLRHTSVEHRLKQGRNL